MRIQDVPTPCYVVDEAKLIRNLELLKKVQEEAGCRILLAQKAFSMFYEYPLIGQYLAGTTASGLYEARLGREEMGKENHVFSPGYREQEMDEIVSVCDHVIFNSFSQLKKYRDRCLGRTSIGLRINPECSTQGDHAIYDPCAPGSRLGVTLENFKKALLEDPDALEGVEGLHFHTLCEQNSDDLERTLRAAEEKFGDYIGQMKWLNMGGGHHITREDYDVELLIRCVRRVKDTYGVEVYLEPGEAVALNAGYLVTEVLDVVDNGIRTLILDASAACHMPDVLEMPYRPPLKDSGKPGEKAYTYRLSSCTCLAGDVIGDYSFDREIGPGDRLCFEDMAIYSMVKNNTFNGIGLPHIAVLSAGGDCRVIRSFGYDDFKCRLS
ncbi:carboxynorspermidine decarboxylase [Lachnoclostridium sp. An196]|uniref:carboxynorspermidine decarboxylase n=1 Tax=Lachnoclostridium sp. An196 TaxID=1965583 RepID=UPI000B3978AB|nr:carboxynorspermidine decarboxylase [Lachnoclostridium sp. An196]OUP20327.1 carboxynorspermidine decarboxylase [Lachnoclostridium sp. An196]